MQSEVPTGKRHWYQLQTTTDSEEIEPLSTDLMQTNTAAMKTTEDSQQEVADSGQETAYPTGSDETDRQIQVPPTDGINSRTSSPVHDTQGGKPPAGNGTDADEVEILPAVQAPQFELDPSDATVQNGRYSPQEPLTLAPAPPQFRNKAEVPQKVQEVSVEEIPPPDRLLNGNDRVGVDVVSGYDNPSFIPDHIPPAPIISSTNETVVASLNAEHSPTTSQVNNAPDTSSSQPDASIAEQNITNNLKTGDSSSHALLQTPVAAVTTSNVSRPEGRAPNGDTPNGVAKTNGVQPLGNDNKAFSIDENIKDAQRMDEATLQCTAADDPRRGSAASDVPEGPEGSPVPSRVPRRVSFSERPPQRAVYDNGTATTGSPMDPAARAVKEQGLGAGEKWRVLRNVTIISAAFMVLFTAFFGAANLQSSVNPSGGLGTVSLTAVYAALIVSNLFLPSVVIKRLGCKWTVAVGMLLFAPYAAAQLAASWASLVPTALLAGAAGAPMWCAKCSYLNAAAGAFSAVTGAPRDLIMVRFFGLFYVLFPLGHVWGNLITSEVLSSATGTAAAANASSLPTLDVAAVCGANFCPTTRSAEENPNLARPPDHLITTIAALFIGLTLLSALMVALGVDNLRRYGERLGEDGGGPDAAAGAALLVATLRLLGDRNQLFLVPITAFIGISQAFLGADFTESYIACAWGIPYIGYVLMGYGLASSLASVVVSWAVKRLGRLPVVAASICLFLVLVGVLRWWTPRPGQGAAYVLLAAAWGFADSTALVINAMYGLLFRGREAAAYSNFSLWGSAGFIITYSYSPHLCAVAKLTILAVVLILSLIGFVLAERALRRILVVEEEARKREEVLATTGISVISDKAHAA